MQGEDVTSVLGEFVVVLVHAVAYACCVYPKSTFTLVRQYGMATYESNHPGVRIWAENAAKAVMQLVYAAAESHKPAIVSIVVTEDSLPVERFGIELRKWAVPQPASQQPVQEAAASPPVDVLASDVQEQLRACILKLYSSVGERAERQGNRSMTMMFEGDPRLDETPEAWITAESQTAESRGRVEPIRAVDVPSGESVFTMNVFRQRGYSKRP